VVEADEAVEAGQGQGEGAQEAELVVDGADLVAEGFDVDDIGAKELNLEEDTGGIVEGLGEAGGAETAGVVAVFEGVGVAGWGAALFGHW